MMDDQLAQFDEAIATLLRVFTVNEKRFPAAEGRMRYSALDFETLAYLETRPGARAKDVAGFLGLKATTVQSVIDRLAARGLVRRDEQSRKGRAVALFLTDEGLSVRAAIQRQNLANCERMLAVLPESERARFVRSIHRIAQAVGDGG